MKHARVSMQKPMTMTVMAMAKERDNDNELRHCSQDRKVGT